MKKSFSQLGQRRLFSLLLCVVWVFLSAPAKLASQDQASNQPKPDSTAELVKLYVSVSDKNGDFISKLNYYDFELFCNKALQQVSFFSKKDEPTGVVFLLDTSGSMKANSLTQRFVSVVARFIEASNKLNEYSVVAFNQEARLSLGWTSDKDKIGTVLSQLENTAPTGQTSLFDAMNLAIGQAKGSRFSKRIVILLSDGNDNTSKITYSKLKETLLKSEVLFYVMGALMKPFPRDISDLQDGRLLDDLASLTGGTSYWCNNQEKLFGSIADLAAELRNQYAHGFKPICAHQRNKPHHVQVELARKPGTKEIKGALIRHIENYQIAFNK